MHPVLNSHRGLASPQRNDDARMTAAEAQRRRLPMLRTRRELKMSRDAHAYVRGSTAQFYDWVYNAEHSIPEGPRVWICGDAHVGNLGPIANTESHVEVELRDLDQTVPGNPAHDLVRLALSLAMAARSSALPGVVTTGWSLSPKTLLGCRVIKGSEWSSGRAPFLPDSGTACCTAPSPATRFSLAS